MHGAGGTVPRGSRGLPTWPQPSGMSPPPAVGLWQCLGATAAPSPHCCPRCGAGNRAAGSWSLAHSSLCVSVSVSVCVRPVVRGCSPNKGVGEQPRAQHRGTPMTPPLQNAPLYCTAATTAQCERFQSPRHRGGERGSTSAAPRTASAQGRDTAAVPLPALHQHKAQSTAQSPLGPRGTAGALGPRGRSTKGGTEPPQPQRGAGVTRRGGSQECQGGSCNGHGSAAAAAGPQQLPAPPGSAGARCLPVPLTPASHTPPGWG